MDEAVPASVRSPAQRDHAADKSCRRPAVALALQHYSSVSEETASGEDTFVDANSGRPVDVQPAIFVRTSS